MLRLLLLGLCSYSGSSLRLFPPLRQLVRHPLSPPLASPLFAEGLSSTSGREERVGVVEEVLGNILDPDLGDDILSAGMVSKVELSEGVITLHLKVRNVNSPVAEDIRRACIDNLSMLDWVSDVHVQLASSRPSPPPVEVGEQKERAGGMSGVRNIIAVSSCKGGVGKSTVSVNLAYTLRKKGFTVGILDADIYGPSLPTMTRPSSPEVRFGPLNQLTPIDFHGVSLMSMGFLNKGAAIMRGPMVNQILTQFVSLCDWGELDYLVVDMPPGTGDIQLTLAQIMNISCAVVVTTPQRLSFVDVVKGIDLFDTVNIPCVAVVENMADYDTYIFDYQFYERVARKITERTAASGTDIDLSELLRTSIDSQKRPRRVFGEGHMRRLREMWGIENVVSLPLVEDVSVCGDAGVPYVLAHPKSLVASRMEELVDKLLAELSRLSNESSVPTIEYSGEINAITFDGASITSRDLRLDCRCASCVEEFTGRQLLDPTKVPDDVKPLAMAPIGRYATSIDWSDGHKSLVPYRQLHNLASRRIQRKDDLASTSNF